MAVFPPLTSKGLFDLLDQKNVDYKVTHHKPLMTVGDARSIRTQAESDQGQIKNLFLRNKKSKMWLLTTHEDREIDLRQTAIELGAKRFSFCSSERLMQYLGVIPGAVSPLGLLNDVNFEVEFYIDELLLDHPYLYVHPLDNRITVEIGTMNLLEFLSSHGHSYKVFKR